MGCGRFDGVGRGEGLAVEAVDMDVEVLVSLWLQSRDVAAGCTWLLCGTLATVSVWSG